MNTESAAVSTVVDQSYVENMPLNGRSFQDLLLLTPGTVTQNPQVGSESTNAGLGSSGEFSVNGQRPESNYYTVDGASANVGASAGIGLFRLQALAVPYQQRPLWERHTRWCRWTICRSFVFRVPLILRNTGAIPAASSPLRQNRE